MKYGDWELRDFSAYWMSPDILLYPSTNSVDEGMLHTENNVRNVVRRITTKNYVLKQHHFRLTLSGDRKYVTVSPGEANIQGYHLITKTSLTIKVPQDEWLSDEYKGEIKQWTLGISLSYDAANNVTGDVVVNSLPLGENETFSGAYLYWFDRCQITNNYDQILILGRVWCQNGTVVQDGTTIPENQGSEDPTDDGRYIEHAFEDDPHKLNAIEGNKVEVMVEGMATTQYDTIPQNITVVSQYDSMRHPVELDRNQYNKPPTFYTNLQDYLNYMGDWYLNKYGDYMTGALRMDHLSIDAKIEQDQEHKEEYIKDSSGEKGLKGKFHGTEGIFISPRNLGSLTNKVVDYENGGTIMTVVPYSYSKGLDFNEGEDAIYAALISRKLGDVGLRIHAQNNGVSRLSHYKDNDIDNTGDCLLIENISGNSAKSSIDFRKSQVFFDSFNGKGFQFYSASPSTNGTKSLDFRIDEYLFSAAEHDIERHRLNDRASTSMSGHNNDTRHIELGLSIGYDAKYGVADKSKVNRDPYLQLDNLRLRSNDISGVINAGVSYKQNTIEVVNADGSRVQSSNKLINVRTGKEDEQEPKNRKYAVPYVRIIPGVYTRNLISEDYIQIGTRECDDVLSDEANTKTKNKIVLGKVGSDNTYDANNYTFLEQDIYNATLDSDSQVFVKSCPFTTLPNGNDQSFNSTNYTEIGGIYSFGNIGCSDKVISHYGGRDSSTGPYNSSSEWVRFTKFRYDHDNDERYGGEYTGEHTKKYGSTYNIEFNTNVANQRANQIIWQYTNGNASNVENSKQYQPLTLSYIHDEITDYPNKTYQDANAYEHKNPTYEVRDFLRLDGGGFSVHGDINNPALSEDVKNDTNREDSTPVERYSVSLIQGRIYNAVYNDIAETYIKDDETEEAIEGMVVALNPETGKYKICDEYESTLVVGVISKNYAQLLGGKSIDSTLDLIESNNQEKYFAVGISGKIPVNVDCDVKPGELLIASETKGLATVTPIKGVLPGTVIGKALSYSEPVEGKEYKRCLMQIMLG